MSQAEVQGQSVGEAVRDWVVSHGWVDAGLQVVAMALFLLLTLMAISGCFYWLWWLVRLLRPTNIGTFIKKEIPGLRKGKVAGQEFEFGELARAESETLRLASQTIEELSFRLGSTEAALKKLEGAFERFEDVSGRA
jgi:hypothetical protein